MMAPTWQTKQALVSYKVLPGEGGDEDLIVLVVVRLPNDLLLQSNT